MTEVCLRAATDPTPLDVLPALHCQERADADHALSRVEREVIALAAADARRGVFAVACERWPRLRRALDFALGRRPATSFADPRLDQLYRFAHAAARGGERLGDVRRLRDRGFGAAQVALAARISRTAA